MAAVQYFIERFSVTCNKPMPHLQLACCPSHCAVPWQDKSIRIYENNNLQPPLELTGHHGNVSAMVIGMVRDRLVFCSASEDYVIVWDSDRCYRRSREGVTASGRVVGTLLGKVEHLSLCPLSAKLAACSGSRVFLLNAEREDVLGVLKAHLGPVTASEFCPWDVNLLISISEDRTFKIWDVKKGDILFESAVLSGGFIIINTNVYTTEIEVLYACKCREYIVKMLMFFFFFFSQRIHCLVCSSWSKTVSSSQGLVMDRASCVWIGNSDGLYLLDLDTSELVMILPLKGDLSISMAGSWAVSNGLGGNMCCLVTSLFGTSIALLEVNSGRALF
uniref:WD repeat domain 27 n=1 Tax=Cyprinus carpio TaxID=7962 RepID=A0A8C1YDB5_CYPCA